MQNQMMLAFSTWSANGLVYFHAQVHILTFFLCFTFQQKAEYGAKYLNSVIAISDLETSLNVYQDCLNKDRDPAIGNINRLGKMNDKTGTWSIVANAHTVWGDAVFTPIQSLLCCVCILVAYCLVLRSYPVFPEHTMAY